VRFVTLTPTESRLRFSAGMDGRGQLTVLSELVPTVRESGPVKESAAGVEEVESRQPVTANTTRRRVVIKTLDSLSQCGSRPRRTRKKLSTQGDEAHSPAASEASATLKRIQRTNRETPLSP